MSTYLKTYKFRLFTNSNQERELGIALETHRRLYNRCLDGRQLCWEMAGLVWSRYEQQKWFTVQNKKNEYYARINAASAQRTLIRLDKSMQAFFARVKKKQNPGYPRFKGKDQFNSFDFTYGDGCKIKTGKLYLQHIGTIRVRWHREIPENGKIKCVSILREGGNWYACFQVELPKSKPTCGTGRVGIDMGLTSFVTTSNGEKLGNSKFMENHLKELRRKQRKLQRCKRGSTNRTKAKHKLTKFHAKIKNTRKDEHHKLARTLVNKYEVLAVESLNIQSMLENNWLSRRISDAGWRQFLDILFFKALEAGGRVIFVDPKNTSQECSHCGAVVKKNLAVRVHSCSCGFSADRDVNAALNILARAEPRIANVEVISH